MSTAALIGVAFASNLSAASGRVGDFALLDQQGYFHQISYYDDHKAVALLVQGNGRRRREGIPAFKAAQAKYQDKVKFFMINPLGDGIARRRCRSSCDEYGLDIPVLMDDAQLVAEGARRQQDRRSVPAASRHDRSALSRPGRQVPRCARSTKCSPASAVKKAKVRARGAAVDVLARQARTRRAAVSVFEGRRADPCRELRALPSRRRHRAVRDEQPRDRARASRR